MPFHNVSMTACNASTETGDWQVYLRSSSFGDLEDWADFKYATVNASFDDRTANLTVKGKFTAHPYNSRNSSLWRAPNHLSNSVAVTGDIQIRFRGVLDTYHSDVLDVNASSPTWLRTVGFGNNSLNVQADEENAGERLQAALGSVSITILFVFVGMILNI